MNCLDPQHLSDFARAHEQARSLGLEWHVVGLEHDFRALAVALDEWESLGRFVCDGFDLVPPSARFWVPGRRAGQVLLVDNPFMVTMKLGPAAVGPRAQAELSTIAPADLMLRSLWLAPSPADAELGPMPDILLEVRLVPRHEDWRLVVEPIQLMAVLDHGPGLWDRTGNGYRLSFGRHRRVLRAGDGLEIIIVNRTDEPIPYLAFTWLATRVGAGLGPVRAATEVDEVAPARPVLTGVARFISMLQNVGVIAPSPDDDDTTRAITPREEDDIPHEP